MAVKKITKAKKTPTKKSPIKRKAPPKKAVKKKASPKKTAKNIKNRRSKKKPSTAKKVSPTKKSPVKRKAPPKKAVKKKASPKKTAKNIKNRRSKKKPSTAKKVSPTRYQGEEAFLASIEPYKLNKKEKYMSAKQKKHFIKILERWKKMLQLEQDRTADKIQNNSNNFADDSDRATHEEGFTLEIRTRERERKLLSKISQSINDLNSGNYGYCINPNCGVEIGIRRLEARPTASLCIDCKTLEEITEKQTYG